MVKHKMNRWFVSVNSILNRKALLTSLIHMPRDLSAKPYFASKSQDQTRVTRSRARRNST